MYGVALTKIFVTVGLPPDCILGKGGLGVQFVIEH